MKGLTVLKSALAGGASVIALVHPVAAKQFDIPAGDLSQALSAYVKQSSVELVFADDVVHGHRSRGAQGDFTETAALTQILRGTGLQAETMATRAVEIVPTPSEPKPRAVRVAANAPAPTVETVVVTAEKKSENIQQVPIAVTALTQQQLTDRQVAGGPDLLREVPNMNFTKTNFSGYDIQLRGIGTQAISVTTDPAVAVAFNDTPFIRNHFFEQEFFDLQDAEVLLGPQGTLYGRNATAGVVNLKSALPTDQYEAMLSADMGNYGNRRLEGMLNLPIVGDKLDIRFAGEWTKRDGYTTDTTVNEPVDGRDLWSGRVTIGWNPTSNFHSDFIWEHFSEDDDRLRSGKQLCETSPSPTSVNGVPVPAGSTGELVAGSAGQLFSGQLSQGCQTTSLYAQSAFEVPNGYSLPYIVALGSAFQSPLNPSTNPYAETTQSTNLRQIQSEILPTYRAKNDTLEFNASYNIDPTLTLLSETGFNQDFLRSTEDYNRFDTTRGLFQYHTTGPSSFPTESNFPGSGLATNGIFKPDPAAGTGNIPADAVDFCDPQLGCSDRILAEDLVEEHAWQFSQELRLASNFLGPFNFSVGGSYLHYETEENYYVFVNALSAFSYLGGDHFGNNGTIDNSDCIQVSDATGGWQTPNPRLGGGEPDQNCIYIDPHSLSSLNNKGHNYFLSQNPYVLNSYAGFGESYFNLTPDLKFTAGLRWTIDQKHFTDIPSEVVAQGYGYTVSGIENQAYERLTGRAVLDWTPKLEFTDQSMFYASYAHGYKAGGANPPGAVFPEFGAGAVAFVDHPLTFKPEYIEAFELGTKNTLLDGTLTLNGDVFYYNYTGYQISEIVDRTAINNNYNAHVEGAEVTANWEPLPGLKFNLAGGWEKTAAASGDGGIDLMDRTAGMPGWMVVKPFPTEASNCILPDYVVAALLQVQNSGGQNFAGFACETAYTLHLDPVTGLPYQLPTPATGNSKFNNSNGTWPIPAGYPGFNPNNPAINNGEGFLKNLSGHALPNAPPLTLSMGGEYSLPVSQDWIGTLRADFYWQDDSWARIFNDNPYDRLHGYTNLNLALILTSANGWQVMGYVKNVFNVTAITGDFLNSDDSGLTTNAFLTDPRLYGIRVTKHLDESDGFWGSDFSGADFFADLFSDKDGGAPPLWIEWGGQAEHLGGQGAVFAPAFLANYPSSSVLWKGTSPTQAQQPPLFDFGEEAKVSFEPSGSDWVISAAVRYGRSKSAKEIDHQTNKIFYTVYKSGSPYNGNQPHGINKFADTQFNRSESHAIIDFEAGKNVGLGMFGLDGSSTLSAGLRFAQFVSHSRVDIRSRPDLEFKYPTFVPPSFELKWPHFHTYHASSHADRKFRGVGPTISWTGSKALAGEPQAGELDFDWGGNGAVLFGRQQTRVQHHASAHYAAYNFVLGYGYSPAYAPRVGGHTWNKTVIVPNIGGFAGLSYRYNNAKISFGYRADVFFGAIDGGMDTHHAETLNMSGPFAKISLGLGG